MNRRETLRTLGQGATAGALAAAALVTAQCVPTEAPAAAVDPLLDLVTRYRNEADRVNSSRGHDDEELLHLGELYEDLKHRTPAATTAAGAVAALKLAHEELAHSFAGFDRPLIAAAIAFFQRASA